MFAFAVCCVRWSNIEVQCNDVINRERTREPVRSSDGRATQPTTKQIKREPKHNPWKALLLLRASENGTQTLARVASGYKRS